MLMRQNFHALLLTPKEQNSSDQGNNICQWGCKHKDEFENIDINDMYTYAEKWWKRRHENFHCY